MTNIIADISALIREDNGATLIILFLGFAYACFMVSLVVFMVIKWGGCWFPFLQKQK